MGNYFLDIQYVALIKGKDNTIFCYFYWGVPQRTFQDLKLFSSTPKSRVMTISSSAYIICSDRIHV